MFKNIRYNWQNISEGQVIGLEAGWGEQPKSLKRTVPIATLLLSHWVQTKLFLEPLPLETSSATILAIVDSSRHLFLLQQTSESDLIQVHLIRGSQVIFLNRNCRETWVSKDPTLCLRDKENHKMRCSPILEIVSKLPEKSERTTNVYQRKLTYLATSLNHQPC